MVYSCHFPYIGTWNCNGTYIFVMVWGGKRKKFLCLLSVIKLEMWSSIQFLLRQFYSPLLLVRLNNTTIRTRDLSLLKVEPSLWYKLNKPSITRKLHPTQRQCIPTKQTEHTRQGRHTIQSAILSKAQRQIAYIRKWAVSSFPTTSSSYNKSPILHRADSPRRDNTNRRGHSDVQNDQLQKPNLVHNNKCCTTQPDQFFSGNGDWFDGRRGPGFLPHEKEYNNRLWVSSNCNLQKLWAKT